MATPQQVQRRGRWSLILGTLFAFVAFAAVAYADDISNSLDASIDPVAEIMPLTVGGANGTTTLYVTPQGADGKNGCNLTGHTSLGLSVSSSNTAVATVSPSSVTFESCGDVKTLTIAPVSAGSVTISASETSNDTGGTFNLAPATFTVNVAPPPNTAPTIVVSGVAGGASYDKGSVPNATCQVTDAEDGPSSFAATLSSIEGPYASDGIGAQQASCSYTDNGPGTPLTVSASKTYGIVDPTAPIVGSTLTPSSPDGFNGWYRSNVSLTWNVSDAESPNSLSTVGALVGCVNQNITSDQAETSYSCAATSAGGSTRPVSVLIKRDATAPSVSGAPTTSPNEAGWYNTSVSIAWLCSDTMSLLATACPSNSAISGEGHDLTASSGSVSDNAGNSTTATSSPAVNIDKTAPTISGSRLPVANAAGWNNTDVVVSFSCDDTLSGIDSCGPTPVTLSANGSGQSVLGTAIDKAGNSNAATVSNVSIDKTAPTVALVGGPANGGAYYFGSVPAAPTCTASDSLSGVDGSCSVSGYGTTVGLHTVSASAKDLAGNVGSSASRTYTVLAWTLNGFFQPVDMGGVFNTVKSGSTVPLKFRVFSGSTEQTDIAAVKSLTYVKITCAGAAIEDAIEEIAPTGGTLLRYDSTGGQFVYNLKTSGKAADCYRATMTTLDGSKIEANFKLK